MTMRRRSVLQMGAVLATIPIAGCGPSTGEPAAPVDAKGAGERGPAAGRGTGAPSEPGRAGSDGVGPGVPDGGADDGAEAPTAKAEAPAAEPPKLDFSRVIARVGKNHGHALAVPFADVSAGLEKTYEVAAGKSGHKHAVTLSVDQMKSLGGGQIVRTKSTNDKGHAHRIVVRCAPAVDPPEWISACQATFTGKDEHELVVPAEDLAAKVDKTYDVQGTAGHAHQVTITAADFEKLLKGAPVSIKTTREPNDAHLHGVTIEYRPRPPTKSQPT